MYTAPRVREKSSFELQKAKGVLFMEWAKINVWDADNAIFQIPLPDFLNIVDIACDPPHNFDSFVVHHTCAYSYFESYWKGPKHETTGHLRAILIAPETSKSLSTKDFHRDHPWDEVFHNVVREGDWDALKALTLCPRSVYLSAFVNSRDIAGILQEPERWGDPFYGFEQRNAAMFLCRLLPFFWVELGTEEGKELLEYIEHLQHCEPCATYCESLALKVRDEIKTVKQA
jgi:hypothetical protein